MAQVEAERTIPLLSHKELGRELRRLREARGWSLTQTMYETRLRDHKISDIEKGLTDVKWSTIQRLLTAFAADSTMGPQRRSASSRGEKSWEATRAA